MNDKPLHDWLAELGAARSAGAFAPRGAVQPWKQTRVPAHYRGIRWLQTAVPLAAAAAIAVAFLVPRLGHVHPMQVAGHAVSVPSSTAVADSTSNSIEGDCNGDGLVNGDDIMCFVRQHTDEGKASALQTDELTRRLLGI